MSPSLINQGLSLHLRAFDCVICLSALLKQRIVRRLRMKPGQYINLWIPSISFWSFLQSHPFVVASCTEGEHTTLEVLLGPQKGLSSKFLRNSTYGSGSAPADLPLALFSGPHGLSAPLADFEIVLLGASDLIVCPGSGVPTTDLRHQHSLLGYRGGFGGRFALWKGAFRSRRLPERTVLMLHGCLGVDHTARLQMCIEVLATALCINIHQGTIGLEFEDLRWSLVYGQRTR